MIGGSNPLITSMFTRLVQCSSVLIVPWKYVKHSLSSTHTGSGFHSFIFLPYRETWPNRVPVFRVVIPLVLVPNNPGENFVFRNPLDSEIRMWVTIKIIQQWRSLVQILPFPPCFQAIALWAIMTAVSVRVPPPPEAIVPSPTYAPVPRSSRQMSWLRPLRPWSPRRHQQMQMQIPRGMSAWMTSNAWRMKNSSLMSSWWMRRNGFKTHLVFSCHSCSCSFGRSWFVGFYGLECCLGWLLSGTRPSILCRFMLTVYGLEVIYSNISWVKEGK